MAITGGGPSSETSYDTNRIQNALTGCPSGQAVELIASGTNNAFLIQPITIPNGVTLFVDGGVTVFASRNPANYQIGIPVTPSVSGGQDACGTVGYNGNGCNPLIASTNTSGSGIMGYGVIDGRGETNLIVNGVAQNYSWNYNTYRAQHAASGSPSSQNNPMMLHTSQAANFTLYKITFKNSPFYHVQWSGVYGANVTSGLTVWGMKIIAPYEELVPGGGGAYFYSEENDGIDPIGNTTNVTIADSYISNGDDNIALSTYSSAMPVSNVTVTNLNTYSGGAISIGCGTRGGISNVLFDTINQYGNASETDATGINIKSAADRGGIVSNITYQHICQQNKAYAIRIDPFYTSTPENTNFIPNFSNIVLRDITILNPAGNGPEQIELEGYDSNNISTVTLDNINVAGIPNVSTHPPENVHITLGPGPVTPTSLASLSGTSVSYSGSITNPAEAPYACSSANFPLLVGELYLSSGNNTNLKSLSAAVMSTYTLNAMLEAPDPTFPALTKSVNFYDGATNVGSSVIAGNGTLAALTLSGISAGTHTYFAQYPGDSFYTAFTFGSVTVTIPVSSVTVTPTPNSLSLNPGGGSSVALLIAPTGGYTGTVSLSCSSPVSYVTCSVSTPPAISGTAAVSATATILVAANYSDCQHLDTALPAGVVRVARAGLIALFMPAMMMLLGVVRNLTRLLYLRSLVVCLVMAGVLSGVVGCSGGSSGTSSVRPQPAGSQTITLTANANGNLVTAAITVNIN